MNIKPKNLLRTSIHLSLKTNRRSANCTLKREHEYVCCSGVVGIRRKMEVGDVRRQPSNKLDYH